MSEAPPAPPKPTKLVRQVASFAGQTAPARGRPLKGCTCTAVPSPVGSGPACASVALRFDGQEVHDGVEGHVSCVFPRWSAWGAVLRSGGPVGWGRGNRVCAAAGGQGGMGAGKGAQTSEASEKDSALTWGWLGNRAAKQPRRKFFRKSLALRCAPQSAARVLGIVLR